MKHNFRKSILFLCSIMLLGAVTILVARPHTSFADEERQLVPEATGIEAWQTFEDGEYSFTLEFPADWEVTTLIEQPRPYPEPEKIVRKYAFTGSEGYVTLSIFLPQGLDLPTWLENQNRVSPDLFPAMEANARLAGYPAAAFVTGNNLILFARSDDYIYRFWYPINDSSSALQANWHILDTFRTIAEHSRSFDADTEIPQSVVDEVQGVIEAVKNHITQDIECPNGTGVQGQGCCSDAPAIQACYRFPCSVQDGQHQGNCTYYVCYQYAGVPFSGNAGTWWDQVPWIPGWYQHTTPPNGASIAWWGGSPGHVGFIPSYWGGGNPTIYEQNWCATCTQVRPSWFTPPHGYIQKGPQPMAVPLTNANIASFN